MVIHWRMPYLASNDLDCGDGEWYYVYMKSLEKHSPAPWELVRRTGNPASPKPLGTGDDWTICSADGKTICFEAGGREVAQETEANTHLMVIAPTMFAAIKDGISVLEGIEGKSDEIWKLLRTMHESIGVKLTVQGPRGDSYLRMLRGILEHYDRFSYVGTSYAANKPIPKTDIEYVIDNNTGPTSEWSFDLVSDDEEFAVWFKLKYG